MKINNELSCTYPEQYRLMSEEELKLYFNSITNRVGLRSEEHHAIVSAAWTKPGALSFLTDAASVLRGAEISIKKGLKNYRCIEKYKLTVASQKARGIRFEYTAKDKPVEQYGELIVFRVKNKFYSVYYISRKELNEGNYPVFQTILDSMSLI